MQGIVEVGDKVYLAPRLLSAVVVSGILRKIFLEEKSILYVVRVTKVEFSEITTEKYLAFLNKHFAKQQNKLIPASRCRKSYEDALSLAREPQA